VIFTCVAYATKRVLDRMFEPKGTVLLVHSDSLHELGEGEGE